MPWLVEIRDWAADMKSSGGKLDFAYSSQSSRFVNFCDTVIFKHDHINGLQRLHLLYKKLTLLACALYHEDHITDRALDLAENLVHWIIKVNGSQEIDKLDVRTEQRYQERITQFLQKSGIEGMPPSVLKQRVRKGMKNAFNERDYEYIKNSMINDDLVVIFQPEGSSKKRLIDGDTFRMHTE